MIEGSAIVALLLFAALCFARQSRRAPTDTETTPWGDVVELPIEARRSNVIQFPSNHGGRL
jgi:hypothetical protein